MAAEEAVGNSPVRFSHKLQKRPDMRTATLRRML